jgi:hypothetical protein
VLPNVVAPSELQRLLKLEFPASLMLAAKISRQLLPLAPMLPELPLESKVALGNL